MDQNLVKTTDGFKSNGLLDFVGEQRKKMWIKTNNGLEFGKKMGLRAMAYQI